MATRPIMTRPQTDVLDVIEKAAIQNKWSISFIIADILFEVVINKRIPSYLQ